MPDVRARLIDQDPGCVGIGRVLQVVIEERLHHVAPEPGAGSAFEPNQADAARFAAAPVMIPGAEHEMDLVAGRVLRCESLEQRGAAVEVFLIEQT